MPQNTVMPAKVVEVDRLFIRFLNKLVRSGYDEETIVKGVVIAEHVIRTRIGRISQSEEILAALGYKSLGGRPRIYPPKPTYSERVVARATPMRKKGRRAKAPIDVAMDDINGGGDDNPAQFSSDNERADIE